MKKNLKYVYILLIYISIGIIPVDAETNGITLKKNQTTLGIGYSETLKYNLSDEFNSSNIIWTSSNSKIVTVQNGKITAISNGTAIITASINGYSTTCKVTVNDSYVAVKGISLNKTSLNILIDTSETIIANINPTNATNKDVTWTSSNTSVASVDSNGKITAKKIGTTIITASINGYSATSIVNVVDKVELKGISLNKTSLNIKEKSSATLNITYNPSNSTNKKITWKSSNNSIATVDQSGKVTAIKAGSATITAVSNDGGFVTTCKVTVEALSKKVTSIELDKKELSIIAGEEANLKVTINPSYAENKNITWESSDKTIATIKDGVVTAKKVGVAEIKAISEDGNKEAICKVTVTSPPIKSIKFEKEKQIAYIGQTVKLTTIADPINSNIENPIWTSSDEEIAIVKDGIVNPLKVGETTITISNEDNSVTASTTIIVMEKPKEKLNITIEGYDLNFDPKQKDYTLKIGREDKLTIKHNTENKNVTINGNQNLKDGSIITITVKDEEKVTYVINIKKDANYTIYFIAAISVLLLLNLIRIFLKKKKK